MVVTKVLMALPDNLKHFVSAWESSPLEQQTLKELTARLLIEEERLKQSDQAVALAAGKSETQAGNQRKPKCYLCGKLGHVKKQCFKNQDGRNTKKCQFCKKLGHIANDCWFLKKKEDHEKLSNAFINTLKIDDSSKAVALLGHATFQDSEWCLDRGASTCILTKNSLWI